MVYYIQQSGIKSNKAKIKGDEYIMTLMNKPSNITINEEETTVTTSSNLTWTFDEILTDCNVSKKAIALIDNMKAILTTDDLRTQFMVRVPLDPTGHDVFNLVHKMREEQLEINSMSHDLFLDMYLLNPLGALRQYFKHSISFIHIERIQKWGIDLKELVKLKQSDNNIHLNEALQKLHFD